MPAAHGETVGLLAYIPDPLVGLEPGLQGGMVGHGRMQAVDDAQPGFDRLLDFLEPGLGQLAAGGGNANRQYLGGEG